MHKKIALNKDRYIFDYNRDKNLVIVIDIIEGKYMTLSDSLIEIYILLEEYEICTLEFIIDKLTLKYSTTNKENLIEIINNSMELLEQSQIIHLGEQ